MTSRAGRAGIALTWFLLFPSIGIVQKYFGTLAALGYAGGGALLLIATTLGVARRPDRIRVVESRVAPWVGVGLMLTLALTFIVLNPVANSGTPSWLSPSGIAGGGSDRDEALNLGAKALLAGRYPYEERTQLNNPVSPMPGTLILAVPFAALGNASWQTLAWFGVFLAGSGYLLGDRRVGVALAVVGLLVSPVILQDLVTGGDLTANSLIVLVALLLLLKCVPDPSVPVPFKIGAALLVGVALSSRSVFVLVLPGFLAALVRRTGVRQALLYLGMSGVAFMVVTVPFYWHAPEAFAPLYMQNKFASFNTAIPGSGWIFPIGSLLFAAVLSRLWNTGAVWTWLLQSGLALTFPVAILVALATARSRWPNFSPATYALPGLWFGALGTALHLLDEARRPSSR